MYLKVIADIDFRIVAAWVSASALTEHMGPIHKMLCIGKAKPEIGPNVGKLIGLKLTIIEDRWVLRGSAEPINIYDYIE